MVSAGIGPQQVPLYLVDGNLGNALGEDLPGRRARGRQGLAARRRGDRRVP